MKRMALNTRLSRSRQYRKIKSTLLEYMAMMDKIVTHGAEPSDLLRDYNKHGELNALRAEDVFGKPDQQAQACSDYAGARRDRAKSNKKLRQRPRHAVIKIENLNINTLINKQ